VQQRTNIGGGHRLAKSFRRTRGLNFCGDSSAPSKQEYDWSSNDTTNKRSNNGNIDNSNNHHHLVKMEFLLPIDPGIRVMHYHYLADALDINDVSSLIIDGDGSWADEILLDIDTTIIDNNFISSGKSKEDLEAQASLTIMEQISKILDVHIPLFPPTSDIGRTQHICLLHQYVLNKVSGRSIRGSTMVYIRPHVSTYYRNNNNVDSTLNDNEGGVIFLSSAVQSSQPNYNIPPASLSFTGYAAKFVNLSPNAVNLYWDGGRKPDGTFHTVLVGPLPSMESIGTATFPGHQFHITPTSNSDHVLQRWTVTEDEPILYHDPLGDMSTVDRVREIEKWTHEGKWTAQTSFQRDTWLINRSFGRDYLVQTKRNWLANFPQPYYSSSRVDDVDDGEEGVLTNVDTMTTAMEDGLHMWQAEYIDQIHTFVTSNLYYILLPEILARLTKDDYDPLIDEQRRLEMRRYQSNSLKKKDGVVDNSNVDTTMRLTLRVLSVAPRVLEAKRFLSPIEVQHLIDLASGTKGDVVMKRSTVSASSVKGSNYNRGKGSRADIRTSNSGWIHREQDVIVDTIFRRIADLLNINEGLMRDLDYKDNDNDNNTWLPTHGRIVEAMQLVRYEAGEEYTAHHDFTYPSMKNRHQPRRYVTVLLYLTGEGDVIDENGIRHSAAFLSKKTNGNDNIAVVVDGLQGGETVFPRAITTSNHDGIKVKPRSGNAIVFYNVLPDGNLDDLSQHAGGKVERGVKYVANIWVWDPIVN
jgi:prolyl 4-hydroxylase